jgi:hypothetical protein
VGADRCGRGHCRYLLRKLASERLYSGRLPCRLGQSRNPYDRTPSVLEDAVLGHEEQFRHLSPRHYFFLRVRVPAVAPVGRWIPADELVATRHEWRACVRPIERPSSVCDSRRRCKRDLSCPSSAYRTCSWTRRA